MMDMVQFAPPTGGVLPYTARADICRGKRNVQNKIQNCVMLEFTLGLMM